MINVIIAEDHHIVRQGVRLILEKAPDIKVVGEAVDGQEAVELVEKLKPHVVIMDIGMPRLNGTQATAKIKALDLPTRVVILSMYSDEALVREVLRNGASGYLLKRSVTEELHLAVRAAIRGEIYLSPSISQAVVGDYLAATAPAAEESGFQQLTPREREVLQLIAEGHTNSAIAQKMQVSVKTVEKHRANLMDKLDIRDVAGLTRIALKHGLIFLDK